MISLRVLVLFWLVAFPNTSPLVGASALASMGRPGLALAMPGCSELPSGSVASFDDEDQFLVRFKDSIAGEDSDQFEPLDAAFEPQFETLLTALLAADLPGADAILTDLEAAGVRYTRTEVTLAASGEVVNGIMERVCPGHTDYLGWGAVLVRSAGTCIAVYQAPHVRADQYSEDITVRAFADDPGACVALFAGAHRNANGTGGLADVAHHMDNLFHALTLNLAGLEAGSDPDVTERHWFIQLHGSKDRPDDPTIVGSNGAGINDQPDNIHPPDLTCEHPLVQVDAAVDAAMNATMGVWGWGLPGDNACNPETGQEDGAYDLAATTNEQGDELEVLGLRDCFMHFEIERTARDEYHAEAGPGHEGVLDLLAAVRNTLGGEPCLPPASP